MFVEPGNAVTYSLYAPSSLVAGVSFADSYAFLDDWVLGVLGGVGVGRVVPAVERHRFGGRQDRWGCAEAGGWCGVASRDDVVRHRCGQDGGEVLRAGKEKLSDKGIASARKRVDPLRRQTGMARERIIDRLVAGFGQRYGLVENAVSPGERERTRELVDAKFATPEWAGRVP